MDTPWLRTRLFVQMFLQFAVWGSWAPVLSVHLQEIGLGPEASSSILGTAALATIIAPLIAGQIADRWFATERFMALSFLASAALFFVASRTEDPTALWWLALGAMLFFAPTLALGNSISFHHLGEQRAQFAWIRAGGTVGWIASGWILSAWMKLTGRPIGDCLLLGAAFAFVNAVYCLTLPHTPPRRDAVEPFAVGKALRMLTDSSFALLTLLAFAMMVFATFYYFRAGNFFVDAGVKKEDVPTVMSIGQFAEIATMAVLPPVFQRLGAKKTIALGVAAWALRFGLFALGQPLWLMVAAQALHGVCFAFAIAGTMIFVERVSAPDVRASAQSLLTLVTYGLGMWAGSVLLGKVAAAHTVEGVSDWASIWKVPAWGCAAVLVVFLAGFRPRDPAVRGPG